MKAIPLKYRMEYSECPGCGSEEDNDDISKKDVIGGDNPAVIDDMYWFDPDDTETRTIAYCDSCHEWSEWGEWPDRYKQWKCSECGGMYDDKYDADQCCT